MKKALFWLLCFGVFTARSQNNILVFQSDFGQKDGAVAAMKGVALGVSPTLKLVDLTHEIPAFNVWEAAYRLVQTGPYFPKGTVFVSICDPGVGTDRRSVVVLTKTGHYIVTPDNGTLTFVAEELGVAALRQIDEGAAPPTRTPSTDATCTPLRGHGWRRKQFLSLRSDRW